MSFAGQGIQFDQFINEHVHPLSEELVSVGSEIDTANEEGEPASQESIENMFLIIDKMRAQGKYMKQIAETINIMLKDVIDEGTGALSKEEQQAEEEDEVSSELIDLARHTREVITILESNGLDPEIIENITQFAEYVEMLY